GIRRLGRLFHRQENAAHLDGPRGIDHPADWSLRRQFDPDDRSATDPYRAANGRRRATRDGGVRRMAAETAAPKIGSERADRNQPTGIGQAAARDREAVEEKRRADAGAGGLGDSGRIDEPSETEGGRHDRAAKRAGEKETVAGGIARLGGESENAGRPNEQNLGRGELHIARHRSAGRARYRRPDRGRSGGAGTNSASPHRNAGPIWDSGSRRRHHERSHYHALRSLSGER